MLRSIKERRHIGHTESQTAPSSYKNMASNHPSEILKRFPTSISELLSRNSTKNKFLIQ